MQLQSATNSIPVDVIHLPSVVVDLITSFSANGSIYFPPTDSCHFVPLATKRVTSHVTVDEELPLSLSMLLDSTCEVTLWSPRAGQPVSLVTSIKLEFLGLSFVHLPFIKVLLSFPPLPMIGPCLWSAPSRPFYPHPHPCLLSSSHPRREPLPSPRFNPIFIFVKHGHGEGERNFCFKSSTSSELSAAICQFCATSNASMLNGSLWPNFRLQISASVLPHTRRCFNQNKNSTLAAKANPLYFRFK